MPEEAQVERKQLPTTARETQNADDFASLLKRDIRPSTPDVEHDVQSAVQWLAKALSEEKDFVKAGARDTILAVIAGIDELLADQINDVLHHQDFRELEGSWRGLHHLVFNTESDTDLKIKVLNITKDELAETLEQYPQVRWEFSPLFKLIYEGEYGQLGGEPFGCFIGDYYFDHKPADVEAIQGVAKLAGAVHAPFIAGASPSVLQIDSWPEISGKENLAPIFETPSYARWNSLRTMEDSRYVALTLPRFLARQPYGESGKPVKEFAFEENTEGADHDKFCWANSAYAMGANITRAFKEYGWCSSIRGVKDGAVEQLPVHVFPTDDGGVDMKCPTEVAIPYRREQELSKLGFLPLLHEKGTDHAAFLGAQTLQRPEEFVDPVAKENAQLSARLTYLFAVCRFAHYLEKLAVSMIGDITSSADMQRFLSDWILQYVERDPNASDVAKRKKPLAAAEVLVEDVEGNPGYYDATFWLKPHYQLEGLKASLRLVSKLPSEKKG